MTADTSRVDADAPGVSRPRVNRLSIVAIALVGVAVTGIALRSGVSIFAGFFWLAVPAVGGGHVALHQIKMGRGRGATLAYIALGICYTAATFALLESVFTGVAYMRQ